VILQAQLADEAEHAKTRGGELLEKSRGYTTIFIERNLLGDFLQFYLITRWKNFWIPVTSGEPVCQMPGH